MPHEEHKDFDHEGVRWTAFLNGWRYDGAGIQKLGVTFMNRHSGEEFRGHMNPGLKTPAALSDQVLAGLLSEAKVEEARRGRAHASLTSPTVRPHGEAPPGLSFDEWGASTYPEGTYTRRRDFALNTARARHLELVEFRDETGTPSLWLIKSRDSQPST